MFVCSIFFFFFFADTQLLIQYRFSHSFSSVRYFSGLKLESTEIVTDQRGRASGVAFVKFSSAEDASKALEKDREHMEIGNGRRPRWLQSISS